MSFDPANYPMEWAEFSRKIRFERAKEQCECEGECGLHDGRDLFFPKAKRCEERNGHPAKWAQGFIVLTVAHLNGKDGPCNCAPLCANEAHVKAMCQRCHLRYDVELHSRNRGDKKINDREPISGPPAPSETGRTKATKDGS